METSTYTDLEIARRVISEIKAKTFKKYNESKNTEYKERFDYFVELENEMYLGNKDAINTINTVIAKELRGNGEGNE